MVFKLSFTFADALVILLCSQQIVRITERTAADIELRTFWDAVKLIFTLNLIQKYHEIQPKYHCAPLTQFLNCSFFHMFKIYFSTIHKINTHVFNPNFWNGRFSKRVVQAICPRSLPCLSRIYGSTQTEKPIYTIQSFNCWIKNCS